MAIVLNFCIALITCLATRQVFGTGFISGGLAMFFGLAAIDAWGF